MPQVGLVDSYWWRKHTTLGGFDVGKKGNPSHCSIFAVTDTFMDDKGNTLDGLVQLHQKFLDGWDYIRQVDYLAAACEYFNIKRLYYDNTQPVMEERELPRECVPIILSSHTGPRAKGKMELAANFSKLVEQKRIRLLNHDRFLSQILCVTNDLQATNTPSGHGDSFISVMLAVGVFYDYYASDRRLGATTIGNIQDIISTSDSSKLTNNMVYKREGLTNKCKICGGIQFDTAPDGQKKICKKCFTIW